MCVYFGMGEGGREKKGGRKGGREGGRDGEQREREREESTLERAISVDLRNLLWSYS